MSQPSVHVRALRHLVRFQAPGELGTFGQAWNPYPDNPKAFSKLQLKELKNGRLAMLAIMGEFSQTSSASYVGWSIFLSEPSIEHIYESMQCGDYS